MPIYEVTSDEIRPIDQTTFRAVNLRERSDLQRLLRDRIDVIAPGCLVLAEEFGEWDDSKRRIDLLALDSEANLVVIELKRTEDGGHMELQAVRYAAMVSTLTFGQAVHVHQRFLEATGRGGEDAETRILEHLGWDEPDDDLFAQEVRIVLASAQFSRELTTAVLWLAERGIDIRCVRLIPYADNERVLIDVQQVIPLPEAEAYQVQVREKVRRERESRRATRDFTKYNVVASGVTFDMLTKREAAFRVLKGLCDAGVDPSAIIERLTKRRTRTFHQIDGDYADEGSFLDAAQRQAGEKGRVFAPGRWYTADAERITRDAKTYVISTQWGGDIDKFMEPILAAFPGHGVEIVPVLD